MITVNALILNQSIEANEVLTVEDLDFHSRRILTGRPDKNFLSENRKNKRFKHRLHRNSYVDPIIIKLNNVIDKYEVRRGDLEELYMGVSVTLNHISIADTCLILSYPCPFHGLSNDILPGTVP